MKTALFNKESSASTSPVFIAYQVLKFFQRNRATKLSMFKIATLVKEMNIQANPKQLMYGLMFLYASGIIEIDGSFIVMKDKNV